MQTIIGTWLNYPRVRISFLIEEDFSLKLTPTNRFKSQFKLPVFPPSATESPSRDFAGVSDMEALLPAVSDTLGNGGGGGKGISLALKQSI